MALTTTCCRNSPPAVQLNPRWANFNPNKSLLAIAVLRKEPFCPSFLLNLAMRSLPLKLDALHILYTEDITLWTTMGCDGQTEETLRRATGTVVECRTYVVNTCTPREARLVTDRVPPRTRIQFVLPGQQVHAAACWSSGVVDGEERVGAFNSGASGMAGIVARVLP
ncbi:hypothetical protein HPB50_021709 [Hyalomma asiaticum]|uniref:Uncharacterized protein n=1 Tax=Hyalomma asiaticum TaxID=266040 RepID=A0ACB7RUZ3_HYAAI|nr:hypothetical protein HPB50_021709 [Hyalomma asiaticum]